MATPTKGALDLLLANREVNGPILRVLGHKNVPGGAAGQNRFRLLLSDGEKTHSFCMLATQMNHLVESEKLNVDSLIRVNKYVCNSVQNSKTVLILLELDVLDGDGGQKEVAGPSAAAAAPPRAPLGEANGSTSSPQKSKSFPRMQPASPMTPRSSSDFRGTSSSPATPGGTPLGRIFPISSLNPYQNRWTIRARVSQKSSIRTWSNARGEGKLFSFILTDESGDIKVAAFRDEVDKFYEMIQINKAYFVTRGTLKAANPQYNSTKNDYEMNLNSDSQITPCEDDANDLPQARFKFVPIGNLESVQPNDFVDLVGIVHDVGEVQSLVSRTTQRELKKRDLTLVDDSRCQVKLTLWGEEALNFPIEGHPVIVGKGLRVSDFGGRSLTTTMGNTTIMISPTHVPEAVRLRGWYEHEGQSLTFDSYRSEGAGGGGGASQIQSLAELKAGGVGTGEKADYMSVVGTVISMRRENCMYQACAGEGCNKKVIDLNNGLYRCEKCNSESPQFKWRLLLSANIADHSENQWVTCFQETAETLIGVSAQDLGNMKELQQNAEFDAAFQEANFKSFNFRLRAKMETYNDETRLKVVVVDAKKIDAAQYAKQLMTDVRKLLDELK